jgi:hypothetical protein
MALSGCEAARSGPGGGRVGGAEAIQWRCRDVRRRGLAPAAAGSEAPKLSLVGDRITFVAEIQKIGGRKVESRSEPPLFARA